MTVEELLPYCRENWETIREQLLNGTYESRPVERVEIPKPDGNGKRMLGIPVVLERLIQQAIHQVLTPIWDPTFSENSYGFRPGRSTHGAVRKAREYVDEGYTWMVDMDLEKFFDRVNHDVLMSRIARQIKDQRLLRRIRVLIWRHWKTPKTRMKKRKERGVPEHVAKPAAYANAGPWKSVALPGMNMAFPNGTLHRWGLKSLLDEHQRFAQSL